jgi:O-antigen ligase
MLLGFFLSPDRQLSLPFLNTYLACVLFYYGIVNNSHARAGYWVFVTVLLSPIFLFLSVGVFAGGAARQLTFNSWACELASSLPWSLSITPHFNVLGAAFAVVIPGLVAVTIFRQRAWVRWSAGLLAVIFGGILALSASGGGWIATMTGILIVLLFCSSRVMQGALLASGLVWAIFPIWHNASWIGAIFYPGALSGRIERWQEIIAVLKDSPLTGLGLGGWWSKASVLGIGGNPHNAYLQLYSDAGALGLIAFIVAAVIGVRLFWQIMHADKGSPYYGFALGSAAGLIAGGIHALIDDNMSLIVPMGNEYIYFAVPLLWLWAALFVVSAQHLLRNSPKHPP